jgi:hypothetical protein
MRFGYLALIGLVSHGMPSRTAKIDELRVTEGAVHPVGHWLEIDEPKVRAVLRGRSLADVTLHFQYLGATDRDVPLQSGEMRRQVALKLRAADGCNVVYASWRFAPKPGVVVQVKSNPARHESGECGNGGYQTVRPQQVSAMPGISLDAEHLFRAAIDGRRLQVWIDGGVVWSGELPPEAFSFDGPVGVRTDNARIRFELRTP